MRSLLQPQVKGLGDLAPVLLHPGDTVDLDDLGRRLADAAYTRVDLVEKRGEYAVRGGIVDVFPPTEEHPLRVEFWGDDVEEIRTFAVADQRTLEKVERLWAPPCRELLLTDAVRRRAAELGEQHPQLLELTDKIANGIAVEGMESLAPALVDEMELLVDLMPKDTHVLVLDPERARSRAHDLVATSEEFLGASWAAAASGGEAPDRPRRRVVQVPRRGPRPRPRGRPAPGGRSARSASTTRPGSATTAWSSGPSTPTRSTPTAATWRPRSATSAAGATPAAASSSCTRATARRSAPSRRWGSTTSRPGSTTGSTTATSTSTSSPSPPAA